MFCIPRVLRHGDFFMPVSDDFYNTAFSRSCSVFLAQIIDFSPKNCYTKEK